MASPLNVKNMPMISKTACPPSPLEYLLVSHEALPLNLRSRGVPPAASPVAGMVDALCATDMKVAPPPPPPAPPALLPTANVSATLPLLLFQTTVVRRSSKATATPPTKTQTSHENCRSHMIRTLAFRRRGRRCPAWRHPTQQGSPVIVCRVLTVGIIVRTLLCSPPSLARSIDNPFSLLSLLFG